MKFKKDLAATWRQRYSQHEIWKVQHTSLCLAHLQRLYKKNGDQLSSILRYHPEIQINIPKVNKFYTVVAYSVHWSLVSFYLKQETGN